MHRISRHIQRKFMSAILASARTHDDCCARMDDSNLVSLALRKDFDSVISVLEAFGLIAPYRGVNDQIVYIAITSEGRYYFEKQSAESSERRWTRGLAIVAILISLAALFLEFEDRGYFGFFKQEKTHVEQSMLD